MVILTVYIMLTVWSSIFTARRYASALYAVVVSPNVSPSVRHKPALYQNG